MVRRHWREIRKIFIWKRAGADSYSLKKINEQTVDDNDDARPSFWIEFVLERLD